MQSIRKPGATWTVALLLVVGLGLSACAEMSQIMLPPAGTAGSTDQSMLARAVKGGGSALEARRVSEQLHLPHPAA
jgi:hypothetical protein